MTSKMTHAVMAMAVVTGTSLAGCQQESMPTPNLYVQSKDIRVIPSEKGSTPTDNPGATGV
jgi:hypothetical protein